MDLGTLYVIQWSAHHGMFMACPYSDMLEKNLAAYDSGDCVGFFPIAFARDRDHAEEVFNRIVEERDCPVGEPAVDIEDRWLN